jgi:heme-degrading monooxygenase HmoA
MRGTSRDSSPASPWRTSPELSVLLRCPLQHQIRWRSYLLSVTRGLNANNRSLEIVVILEVAILDVKGGQEADFEKAFARAQDIIASRQGYLSHDLRRCIENRSRYVLLVFWETLADHTRGFRESAEYQQWKALLHHFYDPFPTVEHYESVGLK